MKNMKNKRMVYHGVKVTELVKITETILKISPHLQECVVSMKDGCIEFLAPDTTLHELRLQLKMWVSNLWKLGLGREATLCSLEHMEIVPC